MRILIYTILLAVVIVFLSACNPQPQANRLLEQAEKLVDNYPDSAMWLIDSLFYPEKSLNKEHYMRFLVTRVQAKYKTHRPVNEDTLIFKARDYFSKHDKDHRMAALAWFYSGCVYREQRYNEKAMEHNKEAEIYASRATDAALQGLIHYNIADLFAVDGFYTKALESYKIAAQFYTTYPEQEAHSLGGVGRMFLLDKKADSALIYLDNHNTFTVKTHPFVV